MEDRGRNVCAGDMTIEKQAFNVKFQSAQMHVQSAKLHMHLADCIVSLTCMLVQPAECCAPAHASTGPYIAAP